MKQCPKSPTCIAVALLFSVIVAAILYAGFTKAPVPVVRYGDTSVFCVPEEHDALDTQFTMQLNITVDDETEEVPANIGNTMHCMAEIHTHREDGTVYIELHDEARINALSFSDLFTVWGLPVEREGYELTVRYNEEDVDSINDVPLEPNGTVDLIYVSLPESENEVDPEDGTMNIQGEI